MTFKKKKFIPDYSRYKVADNRTVFHLTNDLITQNKKKLRLNNDGYMMVRLNDSGNNGGYPE